MIRAVLFAVAAGALVGCLLARVEGWLLAIVATVYGVALLVWARRWLSPPRITRGRRGGDTVGG